MYSIQPPGTLQTCAPSSSARSKFSAATFTIRNTIATDDNIAWQSGMALRILSTVFSSPVDFRLFRFCLVVPSVKRARVFPRSNTSHNTSLLYTNTSVLSQIFNRKHRSDLLSFFLLSCVGEGGEGETSSSPPSH